MRWIKFPFTIIEWVCDILKCCSELVEFEHHKKFGSVCWRIKSGVNCHGWFLKLSVVIRGLSFSIFVPGASPRNPWENFINIFFKLLVVVRNIVKTLLLVILHLRLLIWWFCTMSLWQFIETIGVIRKRLMFFSVWNAWGSILPNPLVVVLLLSMNRLQLVMRRQRLWLISLHLAIKVVGVFFLMNPRGWLKKYLKLMW